MLSVSKSGCTRANAIGVKKLRPISITARRSQRILWKEILDVRLTFRSACRDLDQYKADVKPTLDHIAELEKVAYKATDIYQSYWNYIKANDIPIEVAFKNHVLPL